MTGIDHEEMDSETSTSVLQAYMKEARRYSRSEEETKALNSFLSKKYAESLPQFEQRRRDLTAYYLDMNPDMSRPSAEAKAEEEALKSRDLKTRKELTNLNLLLVVSIANEYPAVQNHVTDLINEGNIGLMKGIDRYDPSRNVPLHNYCGDWIRAYVVRWIINNARLVKVGTTEAQRKLFFNLNKERFRLETLLNSSDVKVIKNGKYEVIKRKVDTQATSVDDFLLAERLSTDKLKIGVEDIREMNLRLAAPEASFQMGSDSEDDSAGPQMDDVKAEGDLPDHILEAVQNRAFREELFAEFRKTLPKKLARKSRVNLYEMVFERRFLKYGEDDQPTLEELADEVGLTRQRLQQIDAQIWDGDPEGKFKLMCGNDPDKPFRGLREFFLDEIGGPV